MKRDMAERLAATVVEGTTVTQAHAVISEFLTQIGVCQVCAGSRVFTYQHPVDIEIANNGGRAEIRSIKPGTSNHCPGCAGTGGDPEYVRWVCDQGLGRRQCEEFKTEGKEDHSGCQLYLKIPWTSRGDDSDD